MHSLDDTIAAVASPAGGAARGIVRLSGPGIRRCLEKCFRPDPPRNLSAVTSRVAVPGVLWLTGFASPLPCDLLLWPGTGSYTGQPVAELHTFGSPPLLEAILEQVCAGGARLADRGEFTLRAFLAGRLDLTQAEAVLGVIDATSGDQLQTALTQLAGGLSRPLRRLRERLLDLVAHLEAAFDFADEDLEFIPRAELLEQIAESSRDVDTMLGQLTKRSAVGELPRVALVGRPNTGKSSLFNALSRGQAIVSDEPGTTRDYLASTLDLEGIRCQLIDTAGMVTVVEGCREDKAIDATMQNFAGAQRRQADVELFCLDATRPMDDWERAELAAEVASPRIIVFTKIDRASGTRGEIEAIATSAQTGAGLETLRQALHDSLAGLDGEVVTATALRCGESLRLAAASLTHAEELARQDGAEELVAAEVRVALDELGKVAGAVYTEDILDRIFSRFCIGK